MINRNQQRSPKQHHKFEPKWLCIGRLTKCCFMCFYLLCYMTSVEEGPLTTKPPPIPTVVLRDGPLDFYGGGWRILQKKKVENHVGEKKKNSNSSGCKKNYWKSSGHKKNNWKSSGCKKKIRPRFARHQFIQTIFHSYADQKIFSLASLGIISFKTHSTAANEYIQLILFIYFTTYIRIIQWCTICKTFKYRYIPLKYHNEWKILVREHYCTLSDVKRMNTSTSTILLHIYDDVNTK